jgi:hypothetical protein
MRTYESFQRLPLIALLAFTAITGFGCPHNYGGGKTKESWPTSHNLKHVRCKTGEVDIGVDANDSVLTNADDRIVFVCSDQKICWKPKTSNVNITIVFPGGTVGLFESKISTLSNESKGGDVCQATQAQKPGQKLTAYQYTIDSEDLTTHKHYPLDPHVIPMGK